MLNHVELHVEPCLTMLNHVEPCSSNKWRIFWNLTQYAGIGIDDLGLTHPHAMRYIPGECIDIFLRVRIEMFPCWCLGLKLVGFKLIAYPWRVALRSLPHVPSMEGEPDSAEDHCGVSPQMSLAILRAFKSHTYR